MITIGGTAKFRHYGISLAESEIIYDTLNRVFQVADETIDADDPAYVTMVEIGFPIPYGESFFESFTMESWFKIKGMIKDMKKRRGKKGVKAYIQFPGTEQGIKSDLVFPILTKNDRTFEMAIEKIEYLVDLIPAQLQKLPAEAEEIYYSFDEKLLKWNPSMAKTNGLNYLYKDNEWKGK